MDLGNLGESGAHRAALARSHSTAIASGPNSAATVCTLVNAPLSNNGRVLGGKALGECLAAAGTGDHNCLARRPSELTLSRFLLLRS